MVIVGPIDPQPQTPKPRVFRRFKASDGPLVRSFRHPDTLKAGGVYSKAPQLSEGVKCIIPQYTII